MPILKRYVCDGCERECYADKEPRIRSYSNSYPEVVICMKCEPYEKKESDGEVPKNINIGINVGRPG